MNLSISHHRLRPARSGVLTGLALTLGLAMAAPVALAQQSSIPAPAAALAAPVAQPAPAAAAGSTEAAPAAAAPLTEEQVVPLVEEENELGRHDLSPWGMYLAADIVVKCVMIALALASVLTWTIFVAKSFELGVARRRLRRDLEGFRGARSLRHATEQVDARSVSTVLIREAEEELRLSAGLREKEGIKERVALQLDRIVAATGRSVSQGTGILATIGAIGPFVGLFGTVWGIMNSFIGIAKTQTTNLAVVAPGIAEALLATAIGLVAAIPAVIFYNVFARAITAYKAQVTDASTQVLILLSRDLDHQSSSEQRSGPAPHVVKVG